MPLSIEHLAALIDYLECSLGEVPCDHTLNQSRAFLRTIEELAPEAITPWLNEHGGFCDCEVVSNVSETLDQLTYRPPLVSVPTKPKQKRPPLAPLVDTGFGFSLEVEAPWKARRGQLPDDGALIFQLGRAIPPLVDEHGLPIARSTMCTWHMQLVPQLFRGGVVRVRVAVAWPASDVVDRSLCFQPRSVCTLTPTSAANSTSLSSLS